MQGLPPGMGASRLRDAVNLRYADGRPRTGRPTRRGGRPPCRGGRPPNAGAAGPLARAAAASPGLDPRGVDSFLDAVAAGSFELHSLVVARHGHIVAGGWFAPYRAQAPQLLYSLSKSFTSTAVGFAVAEGKLHLSDKVVDFFPGQVPPTISANLAALNVEHLLTMSVGNRRTQLQSSPTSMTGSKHFWRSRLNFSRAASFSTTAPRPTCCRPLCRK